VNYGVRGRLKSIISHCVGQTCILASRLHIFIQIFVIFASFGCVVINHQKRGEIVRKMDPGPLG
jgi:cell division protein FtsL